MYFLLIPYSVDEINKLSETIPSLALNFLLFLVITTATILCIGSILHVISEFRKSKKLAKLSNRFCVTSVLLFLSSLLFYLYYVFNLSV